MFIQCDCSDSFFNFLRSSPLPVVTTVIKQFRLEGTSGDQLARAQLKGLIKPALSRICPADSSTPLGMELATSLGTPFQQFTPRTTKLKQILLSKRNFQCCSLCPLVLILLCTSKKGLAPSSLYPPTRYL